MSGSMQENSVPSRKQTSLTNLVPAQRMTPANEEAPIRDPATLPSLYRDETQPQPWRQQQPQLVQQQQHVNNRQQGKRQNNRRSTRRLATQEAMRQNQPQSPQKAPPEGGNEVPTGRQRFFRIAERIMRQEIYNLQIRIEAEMAERARRVRQEQVCVIGEIVLNWLKNPQARVYDGVCFQAVHPLTLSPATLKVQDPSGEWLHRHLQNCPIELSSHCWS